MMQFILPMARNTRTGQTVKQQNLHGTRYNQTQRAECQRIANLMAESLTERSGDLWTGFVQPYTPTERR